MSLIIDSSSSSLFTLNPDHRLCNKHPPLRADRRGMRAQTTIQASFLSRRLSLGETQVNLAIWDTAGQERFHALGPIYYRDADGAVLVYDTTDEESFHKVKNWVKELRKMVGQEIVLCIVGNKIDLDKERQVDKATAAEYAASVGALHCEVGLALNTPQGLAAPHAALAARASMRVKRLGRPSTREAQLGCGTHPCRGRSVAPRPGFAVLGSDPVVIV